MSSGDDLTAGTAPDATGSSGAEKIEQEEGNCVCGSIDIQQNFLCSVSISLPDGFGEGCCLLDVILELVSTVHVLGRGHCYDCMFAHKIHGND